MKNRSSVMVSLQSDIRSLQAQLHQWDEGDKQLYAEVFRDLVAAFVQRGALRQKNKRGPLDNGWRAREHGRT